MSFIDAISNATLMKIFIDADIVVKSVIIILLMFSIFSWSIMISRGYRIIVDLRRAADVQQLLQNVLTREDMKSLADGAEGSGNRIVAAVATEWNWSDEKGQRDYALIRQRMVSAFELKLAKELKELAGPSAWLATIGSSAPFIGLFGTVWGIMNSFIAISLAQETSLAVVAPGMAEALLATAVGLFCAIPASIGYNRIVQGLAEVDQEWRSMGSQLEVAMSRCHYTGR